MDRLLKDFKKLPKLARASTTGQFLEMVMKQFKASVPLFVALKNEALRERHWKQLMEKTGRFFDMAEDVFTLGDMFKMELHNYQVHNIDIYI